MIIKCIIIGSSFCLKGLFFLYRRVLGFRDADKTDIILEEYRHYVLS